MSRNYSDLMGLVTGARQAPSQATTSSISSLVRAGSYNVNGQRSMFNNFLLDGMDNNAYGESNQGFDNQIIAMPPDSVAQFSVVTNKESAEYGRGSAATVNVASASGTNAYHFTLYEFLRNTDLNAAGFFKPNIVSNAGKVTPFHQAAFNRNQFGMNFGGPIMRDKLFYFLDYEGFRQTMTPLPRSQRISAGRGAGQESDAGNQLARSQHRIRELRQLRSLCAAASGGRGRQCAEPVRECVAESGPQPVVL